MSFWSLPSSRDRFRKGRSSSFQREFSPETDMFFETTTPSSFGFPRSNIADRINEVFENHPRRTMRSFDSPMGQFGGRRHHPSADWMDEELQNYRSPLSGDGSPRSRSIFQRSESIPVKVRHDPGYRYERTNGSSRSSTPETTRSGASGSGAASDSGNESCGGADVNEGCNNYEEHPGVTSKSAGRPASFTARRQPKVHHIPIRVEAREGNSSPVTLQSPPTTASPTTQSKINFDGATSSQSTPTATPTNPKVTPTTTQNTNATDSNVRYIPVKPSTTTTDGPTSSPPTPPPKKKTVQDILNEVMVDVSERLRPLVADFSGKRGDKQYMFLDEMLTRNLIRLDDIVTDGNEELRQARRNTVNQVQYCIKELEEKVTRLTTDASQLDEDQCGDSEEMIVETALTIGNDDDDLDDRDSAFVSNGESVQELSMDFNATEQSAEGAPIVEEPADDTPVPVVEEGMNLTVTA